MTTTTDRDIRLYDYWRSSASYRVRIALGLLDLAHARTAIDLLQSAHREPAYLAINPQGLVPALIIDGQTLTQSLAIIEYLHATTPGSRLLPADPLAQARVQQLAFAIAMEIHPICNTSVTAHLVELTGGGDASRQAWMQTFIGCGLAAFEGLLAQAETSEFCFGDTPGMADCCLVPQLYNADRWGVDYQHHPRLLAVAERCAGLEAFQEAHPDKVAPV